LSRIGASARQCAQGASNDKRRFSRVCGGRLPCSFRVRRGDLHWKPKEKAMEAINASSSEYGGYARGWSGLFVVTPGNLVASGVFNPLGSLVSCHCACMIVEIPVMSSGASFFLVGKLRLCLTSGVNFGIMNFTQRNRVLLNKTLFLNVLPHKQPCSIVH